MSSLLLGREGVYLCLLLIEKVSLRNSFESSHISSYLVAKIFRKKDPEDLFLCLFNVFYCAETNVRSPVTRTSDVFRGRNNIAHREICPVFGNPIHMFFLCPTIGIYCREQPKNASKHNTEENERSKGNIFYMLND